MSRPLSPFSILAPVRSGGRLLWPLLFLAGLVLLVAAGCSHSDPGQRDNQPPTAELTTSPVEGEASFYRIRVFWTGADPDGYIVRYEYAVDPPAAFTEEEIADPLSSPNLQSVLIPGPAENLDTLRVSKTDGDGVHTFDWVQTLAFNQDFAFSATQWDSIPCDGFTTVMCPNARFTDMHAVYVRSVDDEGAPSAPDHVAFTTETVAPAATIIRPASRYPLISVGSRITITWDGADPDRNGSPGKPVGYLYRLLDLASLDPRPSIVSASPQLLFEEAGTESLWTYQSSDTLDHTFYPEVPSSYLFGVRAVDEAGAVEPFMTVSNFFRFQSIAGAGRPSMSVYEPTLGTFNFLGTGAEFPAAVPLGAVLRFEVNATADEYGGIIEAMRWGLNVQDVDDDGDWSDWGPVGHLPPMTFTPPAGLQILYIQVRDDEDARTMVTLLLDVFDSPLDRAVLWVDDARDQTYPRDAEHDAFWASLFDDSDRFGSVNDVDIYETFGAGDTYTLAPIPPEPQEMGRYRLIVWESKGDGYNGDSGLWQVTAQRRSLSSYLQAGGAAWIGGTLTVAAMIPSPGVGADFTYPKEMMRNTFPWDFLKLSSSRVTNAKGGSTPGTSKDDNLIAVNPVPGRPEIYPAMEQDPNKISPFKGSISHGDAIFDPIFAQDVPGFTGTLDSLYVYQSVRPNRTFNNKLNALRWHDADPARTQGRVQWFGFPLYYMQKEQAQETFNRSIDWFREEPRP